MLLDMRKSLFSILDQMSVKILFGRISVPSVFFKDGESMDEILSGPGGSGKRKDTSLVSSAAEDGCSAADCFVLLELNKRARHPGKYPNTRQSKQAEKTCFLFKENLIFCNGIAEVYKTVDEVPKP